MISEAYVSIIANSMVWWGLFGVLTHQKLTKLRRKGSAPTPKLRHSSPPPLEDCSTVANNAELHKRHETPPLDLRHYIDHRPLLPYESTK